MVQGWALLGVVGFIIVTLGYHLYNWVIDCSSTVERLGDFCDDDEA